MGLWPTKVHENGIEGKLAMGERDEVDAAVELLRPLECLIRSVRVERIIGRRGLPGGSSDSPRPCLR